MSYQLIWNALKEIEYGAIIITLPNQKKIEFVGKNTGITADINIKDYLAIDSIFTHGDIAFGEGYINNLWTTNNLPNLLCFITVNSNILERFFHANKFRTLILAIKSFFKKNSKKGSKKNIQFHYDLGNEFYELWLDSTMTYSSAIFDHQEVDLSIAQIKKYQKIIEKLSGNSILEIGCGWGGFAEEAIKQNYNVKGLTISKKQQEYAIKRLSNYANKAQIVFQDYRDEKNIYDNVVSIEMFEAVGMKYWQEYFKILNNSLKVGGKAILQIITIDENVFKDYINRVDFIQKHIFPGGILPSKEKIQELAISNNFIIKSEYTFADDYVKTLHIWLKNFDNKESEIIKLGFSEQFIRKWRFYLSYCIAGFTTKRTDVVQFELIKN